MRVLVVDVGGTNVKMLATGQSVSRKLASGPHLTAQCMVEAVKAMTADWEHDVVSLGYPGPVVHGMPSKEPANLGKGWVGFEFAAAFGHPTRIMNDAAMQALGSYRSGRLLFLGLGTGLGSAMVVNGSVAPMELAHLPYKKGRTYEDYIGTRGLKRLGKKKWRRVVAAIVDRLVAALQPEDVVLGGGNVKLLTELPRGARLGENANAFVGGFRLWEPGAMA
jgi:predicted NBD/HSP70 family sugar kinase